MELSELWKKTLTALRPTQQRQKFFTWFQHTALLGVQEVASGNVSVNGSGSGSVNGGKRFTAIIGVPTPFAREWIDHKCRTDLLKALAQADETVIDFQVQVEPGLLNETDIRRTDLSRLFSGDEKKVRKVRGKQQVRFGEQMSNMLNTRYSLESFVVGEDNRLAHAACSAVGKRPGAEYNPLFIYGGVGLGKTHLLQAVGNEILRTNPNALVVYAPAERFINEIVEGIRKFSTQEFRNKYRKVDCLIIDDIQFLANKDRTQEEFFHTFNELYDNHKQIILSSDRPPKELKGIEDRLLSRFEMGMVVDVHLPDVETRLAILQNKCQERQVILPASVLEFIAENVMSSIRELEGVLIKLIAKMELEGMRPDVASVSAMLSPGRSGLMAQEAALNPTEPRTGRASVSAEQMIDLVARFFHISREDLLGEVRRREYLVPRQICMYLIREALGHSFESIGRYFSGRNHTTVLHAWHKVRAQMDEDVQFRKTLATLKQELAAV